MTSLPQPGVLLGIRIDVDLPGPAPHLHLEDVPVLQSTDAAGAPGELGHGFIAVEECCARQLGAHAVGVEKDDMPTLAIFERHENATAHDGILGETKANLSTLGQAIEKKEKPDLLRAVFDPDRLQMDMQRNLPKALRDLADAIEADQMAGTLAGFTPWGFGVDCRDTRIHLLVKLHLAAEVRRSIEVNPK